MKMVIRDSKGKEIGYCDEKGRIYKTGWIEDKSSGFIENGKLYDKNGKKVGDLQDGCDEFAAAARLLLFR